MMRHPHQGDPPGRPYRTFTQVVLGYKKRESGLWAAFSLLLYQLEGLGLGADAPTGVGVHAGLDGDALLVAAVYVHDV